MGVGLSCLLAISPSCNPYRQEIETGLQSSLSGQSAWTAPFFSHPLPSIFVHFRPAVRKQEGSGLVQVLQVVLVLVLVQVQVQVQVPVPVRRLYLQGGSLARFSMCFSESLAQGMSKRRFPLLLCLFPFFAGPSALVPARRKIATVLGRCLVTSLDALTTSSHFNLGRVHGRGLTCAGLLFVPLSSFACLIQKPGRRCFR